MRSVQFLVPVMDMALTDDAADLWSIFILREQLMSKSGELCPLLHDVEYVRVDVHVINSVRIFEEDLIIELLSLCPI
jgi:hypothetical protein